jgi:hypothetical protein
MERRQFLLMTTAASAGIALRPAGALPQAQVSGAPNSLFVDGFEVVTPSTNTAYLFPPGYFEPDSLLPLQKIYPQSDAVTAAASHHRRAYPGLRWECPVRAMGGSNPRFYELLSGPAGMRIGEFLQRDASGDYVPTPDYATLIWESPVAGNYLIRVRCSDQNNTPLLFEFRLQVALDGHLFTAPTRLGNGNGSSPENAMAWNEAVLGNGVLSPSRGKVLVCRGGNYALAAAQLISGAHMATSLIAYPGETPVFNQRMTIVSDDVFIGGLSFHGVGTSNFGVITNSASNHRWSIWRTRFESCFNLQPAAANNQACIGASSNGRVDGRQHVLLAENTYYNCIALHGYDFYNVDTHLCEREHFILDDPAIEVTKSVWFPKAYCRFYEISFCRANLPAQATAVENIIQAYNAAFTVSLPGVGSIEYNFIRGGANLEPLRSNGAGNNLQPVAGAITLINQIRRNTLVGEKVAAMNLDRAFGVERSSHFRSNVLQTLNGGQVIRHGAENANPAWFLEQDTVRGSAGVVDTEGRLVDPGLRGRRGAQVWKPA